MGRTGAPGFFDGLLELVVLVGDAPVVIVGGAVPGRVRVVITGLSGGRLASGPAARVRRTAGLVRGKGGARTSRAGAVGGDFVAFRMAWSGVVVFRA
jgi:hypothetical protein